MALLQYSKERADAFKGTAENSPAYIVGYDAHLEMYNGYEVHNKREQGRKSGHRYLIQVLVAIDALPRGYMVLEKCFADRTDAQNCILWLAEDHLMRNWASVYYITDDCALMFQDNYNPVLPQHFESWGAVE